MRLETVSLKPPVPTGSPISRVQSNSGRSAPRSRWQCSQTASNFAAKASRFSPKKSRPRPTESAPSGGQFGALSEEQHPPLYRTLKKTARAQLQQRRVTGASDMIMPPHVLPPKRCCTLCGSCVMDATSQGLIIHIVTDVAEQLAWSSDAVFTGLCARVFRFSLECLQLAHAQCFAN